MSETLQIESNSGASLQFTDKARLRQFVGVQSSRVANMLEVLAKADGNIDTAFLQSALESVRDLAFEVERGIGMLNELEASHV